MRFARLLEAVNPVQDPGGARGKPVADEFSRWVSSFREIRKPLPALCPLDWRRRL